MDADKLFQRYQELQQYVGWTVDDAARIRTIAPVLEPHLPALVDDFYAEIERHPEAMKVITGGRAQIQRLKGTLLTWLKELLAGPYDAAYVARRWRVGWRHVEIGLDQVYTNVALSRLRNGLLQALQNSWSGEPRALLDVRRSLNLLLDLDLAVIEDAYQAEFLARQKRAQQFTAIGQIAGSAPCMIVILRPNLVIRYFSRFAEDLTGFRAEEVAGQEFARLFVSDTVLRAALTHRINELFAGTPTRGFECPIACKDGTQRWMVWNAQPMMYEDEPAILSVGQDITTLKQAQELALQSERLAAIGQMMTGLAHESGNALARSQACLEMLTFAVENQPKALNLIARVQSAQDHLKQLYDEVRNYAAPLKLDLEDWNLATIWRQAWENLAVARHGKNATLTEKIDGFDLRCKVDHFRLGQVFRNILDNSLAACPEPIEIQVVVSLATHGGQPAVRLTFHDNGPGLTSEQKQRIFEPFFTTKTKGTGLGMAIARRIMDAHGGRIEVGSDNACGAQIVVTLLRKPV
jgi:PAS domain S-box-containing protein